MEILKNIKFVKSGVLLHRNRSESKIQVKSIVLGNVRRLRFTIEIYLVSLLPPSVTKSPIDAWISLYKKAFVNPTNVN